MGEQSVPERVPQPQQKGDRLENTFSRMATMKKLASQFNLSVGEKVRDDDHFWYLTAREYWLQRKTSLDITNVLGQKISHGDSLQDIRKISITEATRQAAKFLELEKEAVTDGLTGAFNRKALDKWLLNLLSRKRSGTVDTVALFDIDNFKLFNEEYGHTVGDAVLRELVKLINEQSRGIDIVARYGGEEFAIIFPSQIDEKNDGLEEALLKRLDSIREKIATELKTRVKEVTKKEIGKDITASFGIMFIDGLITVEDLSELDNKIYDVVDGYLHQAKLIGKNTVVDKNGKYPRENLPPNS